ncbi:MAG: hypothetical protein KGJ23_08895 [Euryarchaeota archaeon]|nr:hypothetical protein [Euryarchaeota archaeon]MDE1836721.1 hypothetical protein [Euryarchaeota archaeon]MDE1881750.1 hypothetical protein [Euryarchaeota archaeon]MDE2044705.1 hypothetical protein [Thermoplasmata archaeon]
MKYEEFRDAITIHLRLHRRGATWADLKEGLGLPQRTACPTWVRRMEEEVGLRREHGPDGMIWQIRAKKGGRR